MSLVAFSRDGKLVMPSLDRSSDRPAVLHRAGRRRIDFTGLEVFTGMLLFAAIWLGVLSFISLSPPVDNIEQLTWVRSLEWGYYKHPPLPTWLIWGPVKLFGLSAWASYGLGAALTLGSIAIMWRLLVTLRGPSYAGLALLAALCIAYYNGRLSYYNHNIVLLFIATTSAALCWQAFATRRLRWWLALGVAIGLGALSKYQIVVTISSVLVFAWNQRAWRDPVHRLGLLCASLVALLIFAPHVEWLRGHDFGPIGYAFDTSIGVGLGVMSRVKNSLGWLADQVLNRGAPAFALLVVAGMQLRRLNRLEPVDSMNHDAPHADPARVLIFAWGLLPLGFMLIVGLTTGADLQAHWGTPFLLFAVPAAMELVPQQRWERLDLVKILWAFLIIQALLLARDCVTSPRGIPALGDHHWRNFDSVEFAHRIGDAAHAELGGPIRVVIGREHEADTLALRLPERPYVLIDGSFDKSPWVKRDAVERCGAVELGPTATLQGGKPVGSLLAGTSWRVLMPRPDAAPCVL
jgi:4-amino-4-deoxy-L-arabinose transferase-like glycosyltransferase